MSLRSCLHKLERRAPARDPPKHDPQYQSLRLLYEAVLDVLEPFAEARREVERRIVVNKPCIVRPDWQRTATGDDARFYFCKETLWAAPEKSQETHQVLDQAIVEAFADEATGTAECAERIGRTPWAVTQKRCGLGIPTARSKGKPG